MKTFLIYKVIRRFFIGLTNPINNLRCHIIFWGNNINYKKFKSNGIPKVSVAIGGSCTFGNDLQMNNGASGNPIGCFERCTFFVDKGAELIIGENLGISQSAIVCHLRIKIGNNVKIGGGVCIYDTDFHSLNHKYRINPVIDMENKVKKPIVIEDNVFIGAHSLILKGVVIGENSIIGAGSVLTKSVPPNEIWAGNPAKYIKSIHY